VQDLRRSGTVPDAGRESPTGTSAMKERWIALLGRCDKPTDAVEDYCRFLGEALAGDGIDLRLERVEWNNVGWPAALRGLRPRAARWQGEWVLVQYTALAWSKRGFAGRFGHVLRVLRECGSRVAVVFHDSEPYSGKRMIDELRRRVQVRAMRRAFDLCDAAIFTVPPERISRRPRELAKASFIPVGANLPSACDEEPRRASGAGKVLTVAVFGVTGGVAGERETREILDAVRHAARHVGAFCLAVFGRHAEERESTLREGLRDLPIEVSVEGVLDARQVARRLRTADVLLFVRGAISTRRGSAIAGIASGLPVIARAGSETAAPITEAGVALYSDEPGNESGAVLTHVLKDADYRATLAEKSRRAYEEHFSWRAIARKYVEALRPGD
jgi:glycosyltransferase involved in cell wall biosynthesis